MIDYKTGNSIAKSNGHAQSITAIHFTRDGKYFATSSNNKHLKIWKTDNCELVKTFSGHQNCIEFF